MRPEEGGGESLELANSHLCPRPLLELLLALEAERGPDADPNDHILPIGWGRRYAHASSSSPAIRAHFIKIGLAKRNDGKNLFTMHGLRKAAASDVATLLVGTQGIKSATGHKSDAMAAY